MKKNNTGKKKFANLTLLNASTHTKYPQTPEEAKLEVFENPCSHRDYVITFDCPEFTSLCPVTGQPDFGHIIINYIPDKYCIESKSLKLYLFSYRNHRAFHEEVVNIILDEVVKISNPRWAEVIGNFNARGGISIKVKASTSNS